MSIWENFSLGFTYLSPVVGVYTLFAMSFSTGGPPIVWSYVLIGLAQLLVCLVFGEIVSQFPISGGLYPWARRLVGKRWAWMAGWVYVWALWVFDTRRVVPDGAYWPAFFAAALAPMFCYYGFEACGDVAEETPNASRTIPKAMRMTIYVGGFAAILVCLALVMAVPDVGAVLKGDDKDPVATTLRAAMGEWGFRAVIAIVLVSFGSCVLSLQAAASRVVFAYARDDMIAGSEWLKRLSPRTHVPTLSLVLSGAIPAAIAVSGLWLPNAVATIINFAAIGIYVAFLMIVLGALMARLRGWQPAGPFSLGALGWPVNIVALAWQVLAITDMAWPRSPQDPWWSNYSVMFTTAVVLGLGLVYMIVARPYDRGQAPAGDAPSLSLNMEWVR
ncbi:MAG: amino acid permease [Betaproteobacteria bacterium]|nr:MAG: amino acid permease [Betaproteobacteria bacterium]